MKRLKRIVIVLLFVLLCESIFVLVSCICIQSIEPTIPILFESSRVLIINKPHGIGHHGEVLSPSPPLSERQQQQNKEGKRRRSGILQIIREQRRRQRRRYDYENGMKVPAERLYGVHRLDKVTSGILVFAKDKFTASILSKYFANGRIEKIYFGCSSKKPTKKKQGLVQGGMKRSRNKGWILERHFRQSSSHDNNNFAKTRFFTAGININSIDNDSRRNNSKNDEWNLTISIHNCNRALKTVIMFRPYTGKTHQLRVAAKAMGIPLLGDPIYRDGTSACNDIDISTTRTMLHASGIHIPKFLDHDEINIWCPPIFFDDDDDIPGDERNTSSVRRTVPSLQSKSLEIAVEKLMTKHCDIDGILNVYIEEGLKRKGKTEK